MSITFVPFDVPGARKYYGNALPYGLQVTTPPEKIPPVPESVTALRAFAQSGKLQELLDRHGAVLFRGFGHPSAETFSELICAAEEARGYRPFEQIGLAGKRSAKAKHVWTANEGSSAKRFYQHNEYARYTHFPSNIHFYSVKKAPKGGKSPIAHSANVFDKINEAVPQLVEDVYKRGLAMKMLFRAPGKEGNDNQFNWAGEFSFGQEFLPGDDQATKQKKVEKQVRRLTSDFKWNEDESIELTQHIPDLHRVADLCGSTGFLAAMELLEISDITDGSLKRKRGEAEDIVNDIKKRRALGCMSPDSKKVSAAIFERANTPQTLDQFDHSLLVASWKFFVKKQETTEKARAARIESERKMKLLERELDDTNKRVAELQSEIDTARALARWVNRKT